MNVFVTVGTHEQPFDRLLDAASIVAAEQPATSFKVQSGVGSWPARTGSILTVADYFDAGEMRACLHWADVVVSQASPGTVFAALDAGAWPIVVGRRARLGEHVDDHQVRFARALHERRVAHDLSGAEPLVPALRRVLRAESRKPSDERRGRCLAAARSSAENAARFRRDVWSALRGAA